MNAQVSVFALKKRESVVCFALAISFVSTSLRDVNASIVFALANVHALGMRRNVTRIFAVVRLVWMGAVESVLIQV